MNEPKLIITPRLKLIPFNNDDFELLHSTFTDSFVRQYLWDNKEVSKDLTQEILLKNYEHFKNDSWGLWKIILKTDNSFAGFAGLWYFFDEYKPQLLYGLLPGKIKNGFATEASHAIIEYAFNTLNFDYLTASCDTPHADSKKVCERLKMKLTIEKEINNKLTSFYRIDKKPNNT